MSIAQNEQNKEVKSIKKKNPKYIKYLTLTTENGLMFSNGTEEGKYIVENTYYNGFDLRLGFRKTDTTDIYNAIYRFPYHGVGYYLSLFNNDAIGMPQAIYYFFTIPLNEQNKRWNFSYTGALGLSYNFNPYDKEVNPRNLFIGSYSNCYVNLGFIAEYTIVSKWKLFGMLGFKHFSNGAYRLPNSGINIVPFTMGVRYKFSDYDFKNNKSIVNKDYKPIGIFNIMMAVGIRDFTKEKMDEYKKMTLGFNYLRQVSYKYRMGLGVDIFFTEKSSDNRSTVRNTTSLALVGSWEWVLTKRLYVPIGLGIYLHRNKENGEQKFYYERAGIRYVIFDNLSLGLTIKAHAGAADYFEWSISYAFKSDPNKY